MTCCCHGAPACRGDDSRDANMLHLTLDFAHKALEVAELRRRGPEHRALHLREESVGTNGPASSWLPDLSPPNLSKTWGTVMTRGP